MVDGCRSVSVVVVLAALAAATAPFFATPSGAAEPGFLETIHRHTTLISTVPGNGDLNPYAVVVAPVSVGKIQKGDVLIDNFNNISNLQGTGTTIVDYHPASRNSALFAALPRQLAGCPGGVGLTTAMAVLKTGWVIVGSTPSLDGTTKTRGPGCLIVLNPNGAVAGTIAGPNINGPWGNMAVIDNGATATLFISMTGTLPGPDVTDPATGDPPVIDKASVLRLELAIAPGRPPVVTGQTVIASGFGAQADKDAFLIGPTGLVLAPDRTTLYVSDAVANRIVAIADAPTRTTSAGTGRIVTKDGLLKRPLAMVMAPDGHLLVCNAKNGQLVEIDPTNGKQLYAQWIDTDQAQTPPGNGDLFGIALKPDGSGFYYVEDDVNTLMEASR
ncbi:MAG TPA: SMP-30/gluconolactonase/LRE family protein [Stellaceae bacterium]|nr:SMP-30/gluconolactonase/LRE family protein [Stellaceae bacterium]